VDRLLVAVMFTDMVGYTALVQADERAGVGNRDSYWSALETHHDAHDGTIVQRLGDGSMSMFPSSLAAVQAAGSRNPASRTMNCRASKLRP
jgi:adenylate cyclase